MDIGNVTQFVNFVSANNLGRLDSSIQAIVNCMDEYRRGCNCWRSNERDANYQKCNKQYLSVARTIVPRFKNEFLAHTTERQISLFTENGNLIVILSR
jgi:hypothetical protein